MLLYHTYKKYNFCKPTSLIPEACTITHITSGKQSHHSTVNQ